MTFFSIFAYGFDRSIISIAASVLGDESAETPAAPRGHMTSTVRLATRGQRLSDFLRPWLVLHGSNLLSIVSGFMLGRIANAVSGNYGFWDLLQDIYGIDRPVNAISWACSVVIIVLPLTRLWIARRSRRAREIAILASLRHKNIDPIIAPFARDAIAWGTSLTLQIAPDLQEGWPLEKVELRFGDRFPFPQHLREPYRRFVRDNSDRLGFDQDGTKYALTRNPRACSDADNLVLEIAKSKYSEAKYYEHCIATVQSQRDQLIEEAVHKGNVSFTNALCMHAVVVTRDGHILLTQRTHKSTYERGTWSVSVEEQLSPVDLQPGARGVLERWARRLLFEELGLEDDYIVDRFRVLSVFLEAHILNCALAVVWPIELLKSEFDKLLRAKPRTDYEFSDWRFLTYRELAEELCSPTCLHHPSSGYRILLALTKRFGSSRVAEKLFEAAGRSR